MTLILLFKVFINLDLFYRQNLFPKLVIASYLGLRVHASYLGLSVRASYLGLRVRASYLGLRFRGGVVPFLDGLLWRPRLVSPHLAPCEAQVMTTQGLVTQPLYV